jgi:hypothetical protein
MKTQAQKTKIYTLETVNGFGERTWKFGTPSILNKGTISYSLNTWKSKASALRAGLREFRQAR